MAGNGAAGSVPAGNGAAFYIDDITWNDLSMEHVYGKINTARSSVGEEYLKRVLRTSLCDPEKLKQRSLRAEQVSADPAEKKQLQKIFRDLGKTKKLSLYDYIFRFHEIKPSGNAVHILLSLLLIAAIILIFVRPVIGIIALVLLFVINISTYFRYKASIEGYFMCFKYIVKMLQAAARICRIPGMRTGAFAPLTQELEADTQELAGLKRGSWLLTNSVSGSLVDVIMDYVRMLFHVDIMRFNSMRKLAVQKEETIDHLFCTLGEIETDLCISDFRESLPAWCRPEFAGNLRLEIAGMYHPLTPTIVKNDLKTCRSILLTGSNASGKSTFLKQVAINQILAQSLDTCLADRFVTGFYKVMSSMALTDNILGNESYFIVEIKSLKRILDEIRDGQGELPVMCFIDEVLRGTNTKERIAASSQILKSMAGRNVLCFAATHDIELTQLLGEDMENYHFEEFVEGNDVIFDYLLKPGPARTRNAIRLMQAYGFDPSITDAAERLADQI